jgi:hypothetical protein
MNKILSLVGIRRAPLVRICAFCLVALAVSPFTAPFSTFDQPIVSPTHDESVSASKTLQDTTPIAFTSSSSEIASPCITFQAAALSHFVDSARICPLVLRL